MKILLLLFTLATLLFSEEHNAKLVYDLTTKNSSKFEKNILKGIPFNKSHFENNLRELDVAVVIHGGAYRYFVRDIKNTIFKNDKKLVKKYKELQKRIRALAQNYDVEFLMCGAALAKNKLRAKDILNFVNIIPSSTIGLVNKQNEGYAYIPVAD